MNIFDKALRYIKEKWETVKKSENAALKEQFPVITVPSNELLQDEAKKPVRKPRTKKISNSSVTSNSVDVPKKSRKSKTKTTSTTSI